MKDTIAEAEAVRAKYREDLSRKKQEKAKKPIRPSPQAEVTEKTEPETTEEAPPPVAKKIFDKMDEKRKKKAKKKSAKRSST